MDVVHCCTIAVAASKSRSLQSSSWACSSLQAISARKRSISLRANSCKDLCIKEIKVCKVNRKTKTHMTKDYVKSAGIASRVPGAAYCCAWSKRSLVPMSANVCGFPPYVTMLLRFEEFRLSSPLFASFSIVHLLQPGTSWANVERHWHFSSHFMYDSLIWQAWNLSSNMVSNALHRSHAFCLNHQTRKQTSKIWSWFRCNFRRVGNPVHINMFGRIT